MKKKMLINGAGYVTYAVTDFGTMSAEEVADKIDPYNYGCSAFVDNQGVMHLKIFID